MEAHRSGDFRRAVECYREVLAAEPANADALYLLSVAAHQTGNFAVAAEIAGRGPATSQFDNIRGLALAAVGDDAAAEDCYRRAIARDNDPQAFNNLGILLRKQGRIAQAIAAYRGAVERNPQFADAWYNLGNAYRSAAGTQEAAASFRRAIEADPQHANALAALGSMLRDIPLLQSALQLVPADAELHCELGDVLQEAGRWDDAATSYRRALAIDPKLARAWYSMSCVANAGWEYGAAVECLRRAVAAAPEWAEAWHNLGQSLFELGAAGEAAERFRTAARLTPLELPRASLALTIPGCPDASNRDVLDARREWADAFLPPRRHTHRTTHRGKLRVGFLSSFFHNDSYMKPVWALLNAHDRTRLHVHLLSDSPESDIGAARRPHPEDSFHYIGAMSNEEAADSIERAGIDLLIDLNSYSAPRRLPLIAMHPAPVVAAWFNLYATSGIAAYDYIAGDRHVIPPGEEQFYCERVVRLPGPYLAFTVDYAVPAVAEPPCLTQGAITFGSLAAQYKITPQVIEAWSAILREVPGSSLIVRNRTLGKASNCAFVREQFQRHGIAADRLRLSGPLPHFEFLQTYGEIDIALDTFPYNGGTTTTEAIWQGVPVLTFAGDRWASRTSASILREGGLGEFVAADREGFVREAVRFARDPETPQRLASLRRSMRERLRNAPVCDAAGLARAMEEFYRSAAETCTPVAEDS